MRTKNKLKHLAWCALGLVSQQAFSQASIPNNGGGASAYLGWNATANQVLEVRNDANQPIEWYTNAIRRMTLSPTLLGQNVNVYTGLDLSGHLGIGNFTNLPGGPPPLTMIHLDNLGNQVAGYRPWMHTGVGMSDASEWMVVVRTAGKSPEV
jgi:hypothetical protein